jgi:magnesium chelatase family protein
MYGRVRGMTVLGVGGHPVTVEAFVGRGLPALTLTGLPGAAVADARDRIRPAVEHAGLEWPLRRVVVNLAPGNLRKEGAGLDLPIAASVLVATGQVPGAAVAGAVFFGELSLKGEVLPTPGVLSVAIAAVRSGSPVVVVPKANAVEAAHEGIHVVAVSSLEQVVMFLRGTWRGDRGRCGAGWQSPAADLADVGPSQARRALEVAAAGERNLLLVSSPGAGGRARPSAGIDRARTDP